MQLPAFASAGNARSRAFNRARRPALVRRILRAAAIAMLVVQPLAAVSAHAAAATRHTDVTVLEDLQALTRVMISQGRAAAALELLADFETDNVGNPDFDYLLGVTALAADRNAVAVHALERVILVQPSHAGAFLDLAIAHYRLGEMDSADVMLAHVESQLDPPPALRAEIAETRARISRTKLTRQWRAEVGAALGYTSNANYGLAVSSLQLTLNDAPVTLLLDPSYRPRHDSFAEARAAVTRTDELQGGVQRELGFNGRFRGYASENGQDQVDGVVTGIWRMPARWSGIEGASLITAGSLRHLSFGANGVTIGQFGAGLRMPAAACQLTGRVDYEHRAYGEASAYDAAIPWMAAGAECKRGAWQYGGLERFGWDMAVNDRPGGDTLRAETLIYARWQARPDLQLGATLLYAYAHDSDSYSAILAGGDRRRVDRFGQKLEAIWVPGKDPRSPWAMFVEFENIRDRSNIGLSSLDVTQFQIGLIFRNF